MKNMNTPGNWETKVISINQQQTKNLRDTYAKNTELELLTILWDTQMVVPTEQKQYRDKVDFWSDVIPTAQQKLLEKWEKTENTKVFHNHNEDHWFALSDQDLETAEMLYETQWINEMWLFKNGKTLENGDVAVQHMIIANHEWDLHDLEWEEWKGKVLTMYTDETWEEKHEYFETIEQAEAREAEIVMLKEYLMNNDWNILQEDQQIRQAA
jgi:hypothetical protein